MSEASRTFERESGNIANPSKSENCQGNFRDLQKDLVVLRVLMLLFDLSGVFAAISLPCKLYAELSEAGSPMRRAFLSVGVGAKRLRSKLYAERSEAARQTRC